MRSGCNFTSTLKMMVKWRRKDNHNAVREWRRQQAESQAEGDMETEPEEQNDTQAEPEEENAAEEADED